MRLREPILAILAAVTLSGPLVLARPATAAPGVPASFAVDDAAPGAGFLLPTSIAFLPDGRFFVSEKRGRVWEVRNGVKRPTAIWAGDNEVLDNGDRGLLCVAVDPNYYVNHFIYLFTVVDPDSNGSDTDQFAYDRLSRYTVNFTDSATVIPSSRRILIGADWAHGVVSCSNSHTCGAIRWGADGSMLLTVGDGAHYEYTDDGGNDGGAFSAGRTNPNEDIGSFRAQDITSLAGKVLRINPATGNGYMSNPYRDSDLASVRSRVWCYGLRNPFRFTMRPGTGSADTSAANPGTLYIGDVGYNTWEEMNVAASGGFNYGWPCYEGLGGRSDYQGSSPAHNGCGSFGTATNPASPRAPLATWNHTDGSLSTPPNIQGNCSIGGVFCVSPQYPALYRNQYFYADYGQNWVRVATVDINNNLVSTAGFMTNGDGPVDFQVDPISKDIFYAAINGNQIRRIRYTGAGSNRPPVAQIAATPLSGQAPLSVSFSSAGSIDPDGDPITFNWVFADGSGSQLANPTHVFNNSGIYTVQLTVSDNKGGTDIKYVTISASLADVPFPATAVLDAFNRANGAIGSPWVDQTSGFSINSNALAPGTGASYIEWNGATFGPDQEAYVTFNAISATSPEHNLMLKTQGTSWTTGHIEVSYDARVSLVSVYTYAPGPGWVLAGQFAVTFAVGDRFGARALRDGSVQVYKNSTRLGITSVAGWPFATLGGRIGVSHDNATAARLDNFGGGTVVLATNTPPVCSITAPPDNSFYYAGQTIGLTGTATDQQSPIDSLLFTWNVDLYHNNHIHPSVYHPTGANATIPGENHDDGTGVHLQVKLAVIDPQGAVSDTSRITLWPETDLTPSAVTVVPDPPLAGQPAHYTFTIANNGRMLAPISHWVLRAGNTVVAQGDTVLGANAIGSFSADATLPNAVTTTLRLKVDSLNVVFETNESNNASVRALTVTGPPGNHAPVAVATGTPLSGQAPLGVSFSGAASTDSDGDSLTFSWTFGDGGTATGRLASHSYTTANTFVAILTVNDGRGGVDTASVVINVTAPPSGFPQTAVLDNFNRANGAPGANWVDQTGSFSITSNTLSPKSGDVYLEWNGAVFGANQEAFVTLAALTGSSHEQNLMLKTQGTTWSSGHIEIGYDQPNSRVVVSTFTPPATWVVAGAVTGVTYAAGNQFGARAQSNGMVTIYKNGTAVGSVSVAGWAFSANGGRIGMSASSATSTRFDNFGGGDVSASNTPPVVSISSPANNSFYYTGQTINLSGSATDVQTPSGPFTYGWIVDLVFGSHVQPSFLTFPGPSASYAGADYDDGTGVRQQIKLTASDPQGAVSDTGRVTIWPEIDLAASAVTVTPDPPVAGQSAHYAFSVTNAGRMPAPASRWVLRAGATLLAQGDAAVPASGASALAADATMPNAVTTTLRLRVDSLATVFETNESNNASVRALTVTGPAGNNAPVAVATGTPSSGQSPLGVSFSGASSTDSDGDSLTFSWTFGDGGTATGRLASHTYTTANSFVAILTVNDGRGGVDTASVVINVTAPPAGFPQTAVLDNFNRANGAIGSNWVDQTGSYSINGNLLAPASGDVYVEWNGSTFGANQEVFVTLSALTAAAPEQNLMLKTQGTTWSSGHIEVSFNQPGSRVFIYTFTPPGTWTTRGTINGVTFAAGNQFGARALANGTVTVYKNGTAVGSASVASWAYNANGGRIGVSVSGATATRLDDFGGGNVPAAAVMADGTPALAQRTPELEAAAPHQISLSGAVPNPTTSGVTFALALPREARVHQSILDIQGREVWSDSPRNLSAGRSRLVWDGRGTRGPVTAGVYLARVEVGDRVFLRRFAIVR